MTSNFHLQKFKILITIKHFTNSKHFLVLFHSKIYYKENYIIFFFDMFLKNI